MSDMTIEELFKKKKTLKLPDGFLLHKIGDCVYKISPLGKIERILDMVALFNQHGKFIGIEVKKSELADGGTRVEEQKV